MTPDQAADLAARTLEAIDNWLWAVRITQEWADYHQERVASDLAGLRKHGGCACDKPIRVVPCSDARRYADGLRRTANLYGVTEWDGTFTPAQQAIHDEVESNTEDLLAALARAEYLEDEK